MKVLITGGGFLGSHLADVPRPDGLARTSDWFRTTPSVDHVRPEASPEPATPVTAATDAARTSAETTAAPEEPKKKRGFWSRVFGRGDKDDKKDAPKKPRQ